MYSREYYIGCAEGMANVYSLVWESRVMILSRDKHDTKGIDSMLASDVTDRFPACKPW